MTLDQLSVLNFKNYGEATIYPDPHVNIFTGLNGQGKTNLLDAIHYLSFCKSYFNPIDSQNIRHGEDFFVVEGVFAQNGDKDKIYCGVKKGQKKTFKKNKTEYERLAEHIGQFPSVVISPYDKDLIRRRERGALKVYGQHYFPVQSSVSGRLDFIQSGFASAK